MNQPRSKPLCRAPLFGPRSTCSCGTPSQRIIGPLPRPLFPSSLLPPMHHCGPCLVPSGTRPAACPAPRRFVCGLRPFRCQSVFLNEIWILGRRPRFPNKTVFPCYGLPFKPSLSPDGTPIPFLGWSIRDGRRRPVPQPKETKPRLRRSRGKPLKACEHVTNLLG